MGQEECEMENCIQEKNIRKGATHMKRSRRILSLVLALIMICTTMGVMAFAAENIDGTVYEFSGSTTIPLQATSDTGATYYTTCTIYVEGSWHPGDGSFCWLIPGTRCAFSGSLSENFSSIRSSDLTSNTLIWNVYYDMGNNNLEHIYTIQVTFDEDESLSVECYTVSGTLYSSKTIRVSLEEA